MPCDSKGSADTLLSVRALREAGTLMPKIARTVTIKTGKNAGSHPSVASLHRALAKAATTTYVALSDEAASQRRTVGPAIGHRRSDGPPFERVGLAIAFNATAQVRALADVAVIDNGLRAVQPHLTAWLAAR